MGEQQQKGLKKRLQHKSEVLAAVLRRCFWPCKVCKQIRLSCDGVECDGKFRQYSLVNPNFLWILPVQQHYFLVTCAGQG